jgi:hypothetical protein
MYICIITQIVSPLFFFLSTLVLLLWWFQQFKKVYIHSCIESTSTIFTFLTSFFYPTYLVCDLPLAWSVFHNIAYMCIRSIFHIWEKTSSFWPSLVIWELGSLSNYLPRLASNQNHPNLSLPSSQNHRHEPLAPNSIYI